MTDPSLAEIVARTYPGWPMFKTDCLNKARREIEVLNAAGYIIVSKEQMTVGDGGAALFQKIAEDAAEKMREAAAKAVEEMTLQLSGGVSIRDQVALTIRALPLDRAMTEAHKDTGA